VSTDELIPVMIALVIFAVAVLRELWRR